MVGAGVRPSSNTPPDASLVPVVSTKTETIANAVPAPTATGRLPSRSPITEPAARPPKTPFHLSCLPAGFSGRMRPVAWCITLSSHTPMTYMGIKISFEIHLEIHESGKS